MNTPTSISVAIITYKRPRFLRECILSIFQNKFRPIEILVSDDSITEATRMVVAELQPPPGITIIHRAGPAVRSQACNARAAIEGCSSEHIVFMHDDDTLTPGAIDKMVDAWAGHDACVSAVFGRQYIINADGKINSATTRRNDSYYRKNERPGAQQSRLWSALTGQFPNNGMLILRSTARAAGYPLESEVGPIPVDFHFALRYAQEAKGDYLLLPDYTSCYRVHPSSILHGKRRKYWGDLGYEKLSEIEVESGAEKEAKAAAMDRFAAAAIMGYLSSGRPKEAFKALRRHGMHLDKSWLTRGLLAGLVCCERLGLRVLPRRE